MVVGSTEIGIIFTFNCVFSVTGYPSVVVVSLYFDRIGGIVFRSWRLEITSPTYLLNKINVQAYIPHQY